MRQAVKCEGPQRHQVTCTQGLSTQTRVFLNASFALVNIPRGLVVTLLRFSEEKEGVVNCCLWFVPLLTSQGVGFPFEALLEKRYLIFVPETILCHWYCGFILHIDVRTGSAGAAGGEADYCRWRCQSLQVEMPVTAGRDADHCRWRC